MTQLLRNVLAVVRLTIVVVGGAYVILALAAVTIVLRAFAAVIWTLMR